MNRTASSTLIAALALLVLLGVALAAGCTTTPSGSTATSTPTPADTTAAGRVTTAVTSGSGSGSAAVAAVSFDRLIPFVPKTAGAWKLDGDAQGLTMKDGEGRDFTMVNGEYLKDGNEDARATVMIQDSAAREHPVQAAVGNLQELRVDRRLVEVGHGQGPARLEVLYQVLERLWSVGAGRRPLHRRHDRRGRLRSRPRRPRERGRLRRPRRGEVAPPVFFRHGPVSLIFFRGE